ncbi:MAG: hypothetical protein M1839_004980 [Geoglossum umbratile]|nr:MAG: hypothetical protein M1839_004980 [Geoglossum umbratile]
MSRPRRVAIIGGGPSGLVSAKTLLRSHPPGTYEPVIFEASSSIGGMWSCEADGDRPHTVYGRMPTNLSKYTVNFSDFSWESVRDIGGPNGGTGDAPIFPKAWQVGRYLAAYSKEYGLESCVRLSCRVSSAVRGTFEDGKRWRVKWERGCNGNALHKPESASEDFHLLIVASGFFSRRFEPDIEGLDDWVRERVYITHTSEVKDVEKLLVAIEEKAERVVPSKPMNKIVVVGGSMSGAEAAASLALGLSSEKYSPRSGNKRVGDYAVYQVASRPFWVLPPITPKDPSIVPILGTSGSSPSLNPAPAFLPLDLCMYDLSRRPPGEIREASLVVAPEKALSMNNYLSSLVGGDQSDLRSEALTVGSDVAQKPPWVAVSKGYAGFVRDGAISIRRGRVERVSVEEASGKVSVTLSGGATLENVIALVMATGYRPQPSLDFLEPYILESLGYKPDNTFLPLLLEKHSTIHPSLPDLGFVGFYRGPHWGVMEMQSRFLGKLWAGGERDSMRLLSASPEESAEIRTKQVLRDSETETGQWPMGDYVGVMEEFARDLGISRCGLANGTGDEKGGPVVPARYIPNTASPQAQATLASLGRTLQASTARFPSFVARATFSALQGTWEFSRTLKSAIPTFPSGTFTGRASFHPRLPTDGGYDGEYLYTEEGEFVTDEGLRLRGSRRYVWRYGEEGDKLSVWFVKSNDGLSVDYFFHELEFFGRSTDALDSDGGGFADGDGGWAATGHHLCEMDDYTSRYRFVFGGTALKRFGVRYLVVGPKKDYSTETWYRR